MQPLVAEPDERMPNYLPPWPTEAELSVVEQGQVTSDKLRNAGKSLAFARNKIMPRQRHGSLRGAAVKLAGPHKFGCLMVNLPAVASKELIDWSLEAIPDWWLGKGGREFTPHITVLYGFRQDTPEQLELLETFLRREGPIHLGLLGLSVFPEGNDGVPLKLDVDSPQLEDLNWNLRNAFDVEVKFPDYVPHVTVAYLNPQFSEPALRLACPLSGRELVIDDAVWSPAEEPKLTISLAAPSLFLGSKAAPTAAPNKPRATKDKLGRERCYDTDGKLVPCNHPDALDANDPDTPREQAQQRTRLEDAELLTDKDQQPAQPEPQQDTSDPQFQAEWDKVVSGMLEEVTSNDVGTHAFSPEEVAAEQNWHSQFIEWRWGLQMPGQDGQTNAGKFAITPADVGPAARFMSGLLNPALGGARYVAGLLDKWAGAGKPRSKSDAALGDELQAFFDRMNPGGEANKQAAELTAAVLGPQAAPIAKELAKASPYTETTAPTAEQRAAAGPVMGKPSKDANVRQRVEKAKKQAQGKAKKEASLSDEERTAAKATAAEKLKAKRIKQEQRGAQQRATQEKQDARFAKVKDSLTDAELNRWWKMSPKERNEFLKRQETAGKLKQASAKAMSAYDGNRGGALVKPAEFKGRKRKSLPNYRTKSVQVDPIKIHLPDLEQQKDWSCGASTMQMVCEYFGVGPQEEAAFRKLLGSSSSQGTNVARMVEFAKEQGLQVEVRDNRTVDELKPLLDAGRPIIVLLQAWGYPQTYKDDGSGHYAIVIGYDDESIYFEDPWIKGRRAKLRKAEFDRRWHDAGSSDVGDGPKRYVRWGLVCWKPTKVIQLKNHPTQLT